MTYIPDDAITSTLNTTTTPLSANATYTGSWELNDARDVMVSCKTDVASTLYFDFSNDATNVDSFPPAGFNVAAGIHEFHAALKGSRYFRVRLINGSGNQSYLRLYTYYGEYRQGNAPIGFTIAEDADALVTKSVISGVGDTTATVTDHRALQVTLPPEGKTAFGEIIVSTPNPIVELTFPYRINNSVTEVRENNSGTVTHDVNLAKLSTGANTNSSATLISKDALRYTPGEGVLSRFTAVFTSGVANSTQIIGIGNESDGLFFGYDGADFGILHRRHGYPEVRTLTVNTASSTAENITITLDGVAVSVAVTNSGAITTTANEIAAGDYSDAGGGWSAYAKGNQVEFVSWTGEPLTGTFSLGGASTAAGTFARSVVGETPTETWITQDNWNGDDKMDGTGITGVTLDPTKGNVFQIRLQWLGYGTMQFFIEDPDDGELHLVHTIEYANAYTVTSLRDPTFRMFIQTKNTTNDSDVVLRTASSAIFNEGTVALSGPRYSVSNNIGSITTTPLPVISFRMGLVDNNKFIRTIAKVLRIFIAVDHTKPMNIRLYANPTLTGASWSKVISGVSAGEYDTSASAVSGGTEILTVPLGQTGSIELDGTADDFAGKLSPGDILTIAAQATSGTNGEAAVAMYIVEKI